MNARTTVLALAVVTAAAAVFAPDGTSSFVDQVVFLDVHERMRDGQGYYEAFRDAFAAFGTRIGEVRSFRAPYLFWAWWPLPTSTLEPLFFLVCVFGAGVAAVRVARVPAFALLPAVWIAAAGHHLGSETWLLSETWAAPLVLASCAAWLARRDGLAAAAAAGAALAREITAPLLLAFTVAQWRRGRSVRPYLVGLAAAAAGWAVHLVLARDWVDPPGNEAATFGTGGLDRLIDMTSYGDRLVPAVVGLAVWLVGLVRLWRSPLRPAIALGLLPLAGLAVGRDYWGIVVMPLLAATVAGVADEAPTATRRRRELPNWVRNPTAGRRITHPIRRVEGSGSASRAGGRGPSRRRRRRRCPGATAGP